MTELSLFDAAATMETTARDTDTGATWNYSKLEGSLYLQRVLRFLMDGAEHSTRDIDRGANVQAVNTWMACLRANNYEYTKRWKGHICLYRLTPESIEKGKKFFAEREHLILTGRI
jgi:hypothetical protein